MKLSRTLLPLAAAAMVVAPTIASAAPFSFGKHHKTAKADKPVKATKTVKTVKKTK